MKKIYHAPQATIIKMDMEDTLLSGSTIDAGVSNEEFDAGSAASSGMEYNSGWSGFADEYAAKNQE